MSIISQEMSEEGMLYGERCGMPVCIVFVSSRWILYAVEARMRDQKYQMKVSDGGRGAICPRKASQKAT